MLDKELEKLADVYIDYINSPKINISDCSNLLINFLERNYTILERDDLYHAIDLHLDLYERPKDKLYFNILQIPKWLFGVVWQEDKDDFVGDLFAQFEEEIDKFKYSHSIFRAKVRIDKKNKNLTIKDNFIKFIEENPEMAFCREHFFWDYNIEYYSKKECKKEYKKYLTYKKKSNIYTEKILDFFKEIIFDLNFKYTHDISKFSFKFADFGEQVYPRYGVTIEKQNFEKMFPSLNVDDRISFKNILLMHFSKKEVLKMVKRVSKLNNKYRKLVEDKYYFWIDILDLDYMPLEII